MLTTLFTLLAMPAPADAAPPTTLARDWSYMLRYLDECPADWDDLISAKGKAAVAGAAPGISEYVIGFTESIYTDEASIILYDDADVAIGAAVADTAGNESFSGDIVDVEPVALLTDCAAPLYPPRYFIRVTTTDTPASFLAIVY
ncbi:MAG: hypothetical protein AAFV53_41370 [Myxococcota bacterium]